MGHFEEQGEQTLAKESFEAMKMTHDIAYTLRDMLDREDTSRFSSQEQIAALKSALEEIMALTNEVLFEIDGSDVFPRDKQKGKNYESSSIGSPII